jgi:hypothetical protein
VISIFLLRWAGGFAKEFGMKTKTCLYGLVCALVLFAGQAHAGGKKGESDSRLSVGVRMHQEHHSFSELPFANGDLSYALAYEFHEPVSFLRLGLSYAPSVKGVIGEPDADGNGLSADSVLTPQLALVWKDNAWRGGVGVLKSLVYGEESDEWTGLYWEFMLGLNLPVGGSGLDVMVYYVFDRWSDLPNFRGDDMDFGVWFGFSF